MLRVLSLEPVGYGESWDEKPGDGAKGQTSGSSQALHTALDRPVAGSREAKK